MTKIELAEMRSAAIHEAGHAFICAMFGGVARARIWRHTQGKSDEKLWAGTCDIYAEPGAPDALVWFGLGGLIAENIAAGVIGDIELICTIADKVAGGDVSDTDLALIENKYSDSDVTAVARLMRKHWSEIEMDAQSVIDQAIN